MLLRRNCDFRRGLSSSRRAVTVLELLISLGVIGLLAALVAPAIQSARESARKVQCLSNLRQIMIAFDGYTSLEQKFPGSYRTQWPKQILPQLGYAPDTEICSLYACPSDWEQATGQIQPGWHISYVMSTGSGEPKGRGVKGYGSDSIKPAQVRDGYSTTVAIAEKLAPPWFYPGNPDWEDVPKKLWERANRRIYWVPGDLDDYYEECHNNAGKPTRGWFPVTVYNHIMPPNDHSCIVYGSKENPTGYGPRAQTASSMHRDGVHAGFLDGSARYVKNTIDRHVWRALGSIAGGEVNHAF